MKKLGFDALRNAKFVALFALLSVLLIPQAPAFAANSQMLPPVMNDGSTTPCDTAHGGVLQWDGTGHIVCIPAIHGDQNGNVNIQPGTNGIVNAGSLNTGNNSHLDAGGPITIADFKKACPNGGNVGFDGSGTLQCCPAGNVVLAVSAHAVSCGPLPITKP
jgi:hypothetical protein